MTEPRNLFSLGLLAIAFIISGCARQQQSSDQQQQQPATDFTQAVAVVHPTEGNDVSGTVTFTKTGDSVEVSAELSGLEMGPHGFHIHQFGDCTASDGTSAGGHYNPTGNNHGDPTQDDRHMGDMGNITAGEEGVATLNYVDPMIKLNGPNSIIGRAIIVHQGQDDMSSQPSGAAGPRIGCGVIGLANTAE